MQFGNLRALCFAVAATAMATVTWATAEARVVTGTMTRDADYGASHGSPNTYTYTSSLTYTDGDKEAYRQGVPMYLMCMDVTTTEPTSGSVYTYTTNAGGAVFHQNGGKSTGEAMINWLFDNFYNNYFTPTASSAHKRIFQQAIWELGNDYAGTKASISGSAGSAQPANDATQAVKDGYGVIYTALQNQVGVITAGYRSNRFDINLFKSTDGTHQNMVAFAVAPIPAALPLLATGVIGLGGLAWRRKSSAANALAS